MAWIDYRKAFDGFPHTRITEVLEIYKVCPTIGTFLKYSTRRWKTQMCLWCDKGVLMTGSTAIGRGISQGDSLPTLLICTSLFPLRFNRQQFVQMWLKADLKLFKKDEDQMKQALIIVKNVSTDVQMTFGLDKCATVVFRNGMIVHSTGINIDCNTHIKSIDAEGTYRYLGMEENTGINQQLMKERIKKEYYQRVRHVLKTQSNAKKQSTGIYSLAKPVYQLQLRYSWAAQI